MCGNFTKDWFHHIVWIRRAWSPGGDAEADHMIVHKMRGGAKQAGQDQLLRPEERLSKLICFVFK